LIDNEITKAHPDRIDAKNDPPSSPSGRLARRESIFEDVDFSSGSDDNTQKQTELRSAAMTSTNSIEQTDERNNRRNGVAVPSAFNAPRAVIHVDVSDDSDEDLDEAGALSPSTGRKVIPLKRQTTPAIRTVARHTHVGGVGADTGDTHELHPLGEVHGVQASHNISGLLPRRAIALDLSSDSEEEVKIKKGAVIKHHNIRFDVSDSD